MRIITLRHKVFKFVLLLQAALLTQAYSGNIELRHRSYTLQSAMIHDLHSYLRINRLQSLKKNTSIPKIPIAMAQETDQIQQEVEQNFDVFTNALNSARSGIELGINPYQFVLEPRHETNLYAEINYPITKIYKRMSDRFKEGELLIQLNDSVVQGNYNKALSQLQKSEAEHTATQQLYENKLASFFELKNAEAELAKAQSELIVAMNNVEATQIFAPFTGMVDYVYYEEFELPAAGKELIKIIDDDVVIARFLIPSSILSNIQVGTEITLHVSELNKEIKARITRIGAMIDPSSSTLKVEAEIENKNKLFKSGMTGIATFKRDPKGEVLSP